MIGALNADELRPVPEIRWDGPSEAEIKAAAIQDEWIADLEKSACSPTEIAKLRLAPRERVVGTWFRQGDLGFVYGPRGLGKTWLALHLAAQISKGGKVGSWDVPVPRQVLYVDGEMPLDGLLERHWALAGGDNGNLIYLQHEALFHTGGKVLNLANPTIQTAVSRLCDTKRVDVLILDNLSCLFSGMKENDADSWELVLSWLLTLRRKRVAVVFVAHAGRNGQMRGTSRREDSAFWILKLTPPDDPGNDEDGARFLCHFDKNRNATEIECPPVEWTFSRGADGRTAISWKPISALQRLRYLVESGVTSASDIALEMKVSVSHVSKLAKRAMEEGWLRRNGRQYVLVPERNPTVFSPEEAKEAAWGSSKY